MSSSEEGKPRTDQELKKENERIRIINHLRSRIPGPEGVGCFLCAWIVEEFDRFGKLSDYPYDSNDKGIFPYLGKVAHIRLEAPRLDVKVGAGIS
jgi:hypothetical protein